MMPMTDESNARRFIEQLFEALSAGLPDPLKIRRKVEEIRDHAPGFPETRFCKGCVLPIVDTVATRFLHEIYGATPEQVHLALRCEGRSTLKKIYQPGEGQSGFSGITWGTNYQRVSKSGKQYPPEARGYQPCPDFGIVHSNPKFTILGETKYAHSRKLSLAGLVKELQYYMRVVREPEKGWDYDFGIGIAYSTAGDTPRRAELIRDHWAADRFMVARFHR